jgi:hypothetical protein
MPAEIIITSVPRGLDGGSGFQTVKRTREMSLAVSERLHQRSGYTHRFAAGDKRNPIIISHQIEKLKAGVFHVLGLIKDAGTDHSGRQNRLAHLIAFDESDIYGNQAGPASVAKQLRDARLLVDSWEQQPHEAEPLAIPSCNAEPQICQAWIDAGLDPGVAGELAEAAATGTKSVLIVPASADVIALFADAMLLMPPASRWKTTFTTCGSGRENYVWQAVRADLAEANDARKLPGVIDLTQAYAGKDSPYASFAKTGKGQLPWQQSASTVPDAETDSAPPIGSQAPLSNTQITPPHHFEEVFDASGSTTSPQLDSSNAMQGQGRQPKKRRLSELSSVPAKVPSTPVQTNYLRNAAMVVVSSLFLALIALAAINVKPITVFISRVFEQLTQESPDSKQIAGHESHKEIINLTRPRFVKKPQDEIKKDQGEEDQGGQKWIEAQGEFLELIDYWWADYQEARRADLALQQQEAFRQFKALPEATSLCSGVNRSLSGIQTNSVKIGPVQWDLLTSPRISLATPKDFSAQVKEMNVDSEANDGIKPMWGITVKGASVGDSSGVSLVEVYVESSDIDGEPDCLWMRPTEQFKQETPDGQNLLRSLLLLTAKNPENGKAQTHSIQFFKPEGGQETKVDFFKAKNTELGINYPREIMSVSDIDSLKFSLEVAAPCNKKAVLEETFYEDSFGSRQRPTEAEPRRITVLQKIQEFTEAQFEYRRYLKYYVDVNLSRLFVVFNHERKAINVPNSGWVKERPEKGTRSRPLYLEDEEVFVFERDKWFSGLKGIIKGQYQYEDRANNLDGSFDQFVKLMDGRYSTGWIKTYWDIAKKENEKQRREAKEEAEDGKVPPGRLPLRYENKDAWLKKVESSKPRPERAAKIYSDELLRMFNYGKSYLEKFFDDIREANMSLVLSPPKFAIKRVETTAYGRDDREYPVVLIDQDAQPPEGRSSNDGKGASLN